MTSYHHRYIEKLKLKVEIKDKDVAVLGCSFGKECEILIAEGAKSVTGFDLTPLIGSNFAHEKVSYKRLSVCETLEPDNKFDIIYSIAVFEHVHDLDNAYKEAARICKPGGIIMILSSPIWFAPYGNHMNAKLISMPWCHLIFTPSALQDEIAKKHPEIFADKKILDQVINRIYDPTYYNHLPSNSYLSAVSKVEGVNIEQNAIWPAAVEESYKEEYLSKCLDLGYTEKELMSGGHFFLAKKL